MAGMVVHAELLLDHAGQDGRGPDSGMQAVSHGTAFDNVVELLALRLGQLAGPSAAVAFLNPLLPILVPVAHPGMNARAVNVEQVGNVGWGVAVGAEQELPANARRRVGPCRSEPLGGAPGACAVCGSRPGRRWGSWRAMLHYYCADSGTRTASQQEKTLRRAPSDGNGRRRTVSKPAQDRTMLKPL